VSKRPVDRVQLKFVRTVNSRQSPSIQVFEDELGGNLKTRTSFTDPGAPLDPNLCVLETLFASLNPPEATWILVLEDKCSRRVDESLLDAVKAVVRAGLATVPRLSPTFQQDHRFGCVG